MPKSQLRQILGQLGYRVVDRDDTWAEVLVASDSERWRGRGLDGDDALSDVLGQMLPSALARQLLAEIVLATPATDPQPQPAGAPVATVAPAPSPTGAPSPTVPPATQAPVVVRAAATTERVATKDPCPHALLCSPERGLIAIVDGARPTVIGATAVKLASLALTTAFETSTTLAPIRMRGLPVLLGAVQHANRDLVEAIRHDPKLRAMTASLAAVLAVGGQVAIAHIGTVHVYRFRRGQLETLTPTVTAVQDSRKSTGKYKKPDARELAKGRGGRVLGADKTAEVDSSIVPAEPGDRFVLVTDSPRPPPERAILEALARHPDASVAATTIAALVREHGAAETATAAVLDLAIPDDPPSV